MAEVAEGIVLICLGIWLLKYRLVLRTRFRPYAERLASVACGVPLGLSAPLFGWQPLGYGTLFLALFGVLLSTCHAFGTAVIVSETLALAIAGFIWHSGFCGALPKELPPLYFDFVTWHEMILAVCMVLIVSLLACTPGFANVISLIYIAVPLLGSLFVVLGVASVFPQLHLLDREALLNDATCRNSPGSSRSYDVGWEFLMWVVVGSFGIGLQILLAKQARKAAEGEFGPKAPGSGLLESLLPQASDENGPNIPKPSDSNNRYQLIVKAMFAEPDADQSHLTENERKLVDVCRNDEFERDRVLWGGGLI